MLAASHDLLTRTITELEASFAAGRFDTSAMRRTGEACLLVGFSELADHASRLLARSPKEAFFAGAIMYFTPDANAIERLRRLRDVDVLERDFPPFRRSDVEEGARSQEETRLAWERRYGDALRLAREHPRQPPETSMVSQIASTAAVLGDFHIVEQILRDEAVPSGEAYYVRLILAIEYARCQVRPEAERVITGLAPPVQGWHAVQLALGLSGRRPWGGYPYADW
jgi:hypothetical protein